METVTPLKKLLFAVARLDLEGTQGPGAATAFAFGYEYEDRVIPFLVTTRSILTGVRRGRVVLTLGECGKPLVGQQAAIEFDEFESLWHGHPRSDVDIAVTPLAPLMLQVERSGKSAYCPLIAASLVPTALELDGLDAMESIVLVGHAVPVRDHSNGVALIGRGTTITPVHADYYQRPSFLIDAPIWPGEAGSPVLLVSPYEGLPGGMVTRTLLLGILGGALTTDAAGGSQIVPVPTMGAERLHVGEVWSSHLIPQVVADFLETAGNEAEPMASP